MCRSSLIADVVSKENREKNSNIDWELGIILSLYVLIIHTRSWRKRRRPQRHTLWYRKVCVYASSLNRDSENL